MMIEGSGRPKNMWIRWIRIRIRIRNTASWFRIQIHNNLYGYDLAPDLDPVPDLETIPDPESVYLSYIGSFIC
jgi:hypothetical protein